jgi:hypothetical protein
VDNDLVGIFALLEDFVVMFRDSSQSRQCNQALHPTPSVAFRQMPSSFKSLKEAKYYWELIIARALRWRETLGEGLVDFSVDCTTSTAKEMAVFDEKRLEWHHDFMPLVQTFRSRPGTNDFLGASVLKIQFLVSCITTDLVRLRD